MNSGISIIYYLDSEFGFRRMSIRLQEKSDIVTAKSTELRDVIPRRKQSCQYRVLHYVIWFFLLTENLSFQYPDSSTLRLIHLKLLIFNFQGTCLVTTTTSVDLFGPLQCDCLNKRTVDRVIPPGIIDRVSFVCSKRLIVTFDFIDLIPNLDFYPTLVSGSDWRKTNL